MISKAKVYSLFLLFDTVQVALTFTLLNGQNVLLSEMFPMICRDVSLLSVCQRMDCFPSPTKIPFSRLYSNIIDVEFSRDDDDKEEPDADNLLEYSLNLDPEWKDIPIQFMDNESVGKNKYIDCNLAFMMEMDGIEYSIAIPCETQVGIVCEGSADGGAGDNDYFYLDPDEEENIEIMEIAAAQFAKEYGEELKIKRTPRTLTVEGDLKSITKDWSNLLDEQTIHIDTLLTENNNNEDDKYIDSFFKRELGANYREEFLLDDDDEMDEEVKQFAKLFNVPGIGTETDDLDGLEQMINEINSDIDFETAKEYQPSNNNMSDKNSGLRLLSFQGPDNKYYSLVQMLKPVILVGRNEDPTIESPKRILLTRDETDEIIPKLEADFKKELEAAGISF